METMARPGHARSSHPFALLCLLALIMAAGCGNDWEHVHGTEAEEGQEVVFAAPVIRFPTGGEEVRSTTPTLAWYAVPSAASFHIEVSDRDDFETLEEQVEDIPSTSFMISDFPIREGKHFWRVRARDAQNQWSPWSTVSSFIVVSTTSGL